MKLNFGEFYLTLIVKDNNLLDGVKLIYKIINVLNGVTKCLVVL